jgi:hypothetical protein
MANRVQAWPEYQEIREILQHMVDDVQRIIQLAWEVYMRGNVFNNWKRNRHKVCFVLTCKNFIIRNST